MADESRDEATDPAPLFRVNDQPYRAMEKVMTYLNGRLKDAGLEPVDRYSRPGRVVQHPTMFPTTEAHVTLFPHDDTLVAVAAALAHLGGSL